jgi:hypothetical protein
LAIWPFAIGWQVRDGFSGLVIALTNPSSACPLPVTSSRARRELVSPPVHRRRTYQLHHTAKVKWQLATWIKMELPTNGSCRLR